MLPLVLGTVGPVLLSLYFVIRGVTSGSTGGSLGNFLFAAILGGIAVFFALKLKKAYDEQQAANAEWQRATGAPAPSQAPSPAPARDDRRFAPSDYEPSHHNASITRTTTTPPSPGYGRYDDRHLPPAQQPVRDFTPPYTPPHYPGQMPHQPQQPDRSAAIAAGLGGLALGGVAGMALGSATAASAHSGHGGGHGNHGGHGGETWAPKRQDDASLGSALSGPSSGSQNSTLAPITGDQLDGHNATGAAGAAAAAGAVGLGYGSGALDPILGDSLDAKQDPSSTAPISGDTLDGLGQGSALEPVSGDDIWGDTASYDPTAPISGEALDAQGGYAQTAAIDASDLDRDYGGHDDTAPVESSTFGGYDHGAMEPVSSQEVERSYEPEPARYEPEPASNDWGSSGSDDNSSDDWS